MPMLCAGVCLLMLLMPSDGSLPLPEIGLATRQLLNLREGSNRPAVSCVREECSLSLSISFVLGIFLLRFPRCLEFGSAFQSLLFCQLLQCILK